MLTTLAIALHSWQSFYSMLGSAAATLIGLTFVMVSLGVRIITEESVWRVHVFITPLIVHFSGILVLSLLMIAPCPSLRLLPLEIAALGIVGIAYLATLIPGFVRLRAENSPMHIWKIYGVYVPAVCYLGIIAGGFEIWSSVGRGFWIVAAALLCLVGVTIRNTWASTLAVAAKQPRREAVSTPRPTRPRRARPAAKP